MSLRLTPKPREQQPVLRTAAWVCSCTCVNFVHHAFCGRCGALKPQTVAHPRKPPRR